MVADRDKMEELAESQEKEIFENEEKLSSSIDDVNETVNQKMDELFPDDEDSGKEHEDPELVSLVVNGKTVEVPKEKVFETGVAALQKETAAERKLELAAQKEAELAERQAEIEARAAELAEIEASLNIDDIEPTELGKEFAEAIFEDDEKVAKVISNIDKRLNALAKKEKLVEERLIREEQAKRQDVIKYYHSQYKDIAEDPDMHAVFNARLSRISSVDPTVPATAAIDQAAKEVKERFAASVNVKENLIKQPNSRSARRVAQNKELKEESLSDVLAEMRASRAQSF